MDEEAEEGAGGGGRWLVLICLIGVAARLLTLGKNSVWGDELVWIQIASEPVAGVLERCRIAFHPPLFALMLHYWMKLFGSGDVAVYLLSAIFGMATTPLVYGIGAELGERRAGLLAALLFALSPLSVYCSQEIRPYAMQPFLFAASSLALLRGREPRSRVWLGAYVVLGALACWLHYYAFFMFLGHLAYLLAAEEDWKAGLKLAVVLYAGIGLLFLPQLLVLLGHMGGAIRFSHESHVVAGRWKQILAAPSQLVLGLGVSRYSWRLFLPSLAVLVVVNLIGLRGWWRRRREPAVWANALLFLVPLVSSWLVFNLLAPLFFFPRYFAFLAVPYLLLLSIGVISLPGGRVRWAGAILLTLAVLHPLGDYYRGWTKIPYRQLAAAIQAEAEAEDLVVVSAGMSSIFSRYYSGKAPVLLDPQAGETRLDRSVGTVWVLSQHTPHNPKLRDHPALEAWLARELPGHREVSRESHLVLRASEARLRRFRPGP